MSADTTPTNERVESPPLVLGRGVLLHDRWRLDGCLASGGYGDVWTAEDIETNAIVAIKILRPDAGNNDPGALARMQLEARILEDIDHPNIVQVFGYYESPYGPFLVMEMLNGLAIDQSLQKHGPAPFERVAPAALQLLSALQAAHDNDVLHRDIKPENIILVPGAHGEVAKLIDFGIAKAQSIFGSEETSGGLTMVKTRAGGFMGTPRYSAPEQVVGDPTGPTADLFALGLVLAEWLTGQMRLDAERHADLMTQLLSPAPIQLEDVPYRWKRWLTKILEKDPTARFQSATEAAAALNEWVIKGGQRAEFLDDGFYPGGHQFERKGPAFVGQNQPLELDMDRVRAADQARPVQVTPMPMGQQPMSADTSQSMMALQARPMFNAAQASTPHIQAEDEDGPVEYLLYATVALFSGAVVYLLLLWLVGGLSLP